MLATRFLRTAVVFGLLAMILGIVMAATTDHTQAPTHAHMNLVGFVSMMLFGLYYRLHPVCAKTVAARVHYWLSAFGAAGMVVGLYLLFDGKPEAEAIAVVGSILTVLGMGAFTFVVFQAKTPTTI